MTTIQGLQHRTTEAPPRWYPIPLQLRYKATSEHGPLYGFGQTRMMSSKGIIFGGGNGLKPGMKVEIAVAWPPLLDRHIRLQLVLEVTITNTLHGVAEARIRAYDFRTCQTVAQSEQHHPPLRECNDCGVIGAVAHGA